MLPTISSLKFAGLAVPIPILEFVVSILNKPELTLKALVEEVKVNAAAPEVEVKDKAPVVKVKPFEAVKVPAEVIVPVPVAEIFPLVVTASPAVAGESVVPALVQ